MKRFLPILWIAAFAALSFSQDWQIIKVGDDVYKPNEGFFIDANTGWYVGSEGVVVKTTDGAETYTVVREPVDGSPTWKDVAFANANVGYACAYGGFIFKTTDGGLTWTNVGDTTNYTADLIDIAVVDENIVYAAGKSGTLLKTTDGGASWTKSDFAFGKDLDGGLGFCNANIGVVAQDGNDGQTWYTNDGGATWNEVLLTFPPGTNSSRIYDVCAGGDSTIVVVGYHYVKFVSQDGGKTYTQSGDYTFEYERGITIDILDENTFFVAGTEGHVEKTTDGGATWTTIDAPSGRTPTFIDFIDVNTGYVFLYDGQWFKTTDGGASWTPILEWPNTSWWGIALPEDDKIVMTSYSGGEMTMSTDGGMTWTYPTSTATGTGVSLYECEFIDASNGLIAGSKGNIRRTTDGGATWTLIDNPMYQMTNKHINALHYVNANTVFAGGSSGNIMKSTDGGQTWNSVEKGGSKTVYDFWPVSSKQVIATASSGQIYVSNASLDTFTMAKDYGGMSMRAVEFRGDIGLVVASKGFIYRTTVAKWDTLTEVFEEADGDDFYDVEFITDSLVYVVGEHGKIYKSEDAGLTWTKEDSVIDVTFQKVRYRNNRLWIGGKDGTIIMKDLTPPTPITGLVINEFMASNNTAFTDENGEYDDWIEIYNSNDFPVDVGGLYITDDLAEPTQWQIPATAPDTTTIPAGGFLVLWADKESEQGVLHLELKLSSDGEQIGLVEMFDGSPRFIDSLSFEEQNADTSYGYVSDGGGERAFFSPASPGESNSNGTIVGIKENPNTVVTEYRLSQNYPNPFNPSTTIAFALKKAGKTTLTVYSVTGQKVATLLNKDMKAGTVEISWDASKLASGVYFYELKSGNFISVRKMLLMK